MEEHKEWKDVSEKFLKKLNTKKICLERILSNKNQIPIKRELMLDDEQLKQDILNTLGSVDITNSSFKESKLTTALKWTLPSVLYYGFFILPGDNLITRFAESFDTPVAHYSAYPALCLIPGTTAIVISTEYLLGNKPRRKGDIFLLDPLKIATGIAGMSAFHDMSGLWVGLKALLGEPKYVDMWVKCWTDPNYEFFAQGDWWFFNWKVPNQHLTGHQFFAMEAGIFAAFAVATYLIHHYVNKRRREKEENYFALNRLIKNEEIPFEEIKNEFDIYFNNKNKDNKKFLEFRYKLEKIATERTIASIEEAVDEFEGARKKFSFKEFMLKKVIDKDSLNIREAKEKIKLGDNCIKYYQKSLNKFLKFLIEKNKDRINQEIQKYKEMIKQVNEETEDEEDIFKNFFGGIGKKLYNKLAKGIWDWENKKNVFVKEVHKMLNYKYPIKNIESFLDSFYDWKEPEECFSYLEPELIKNMVGDDGRN